MNFKSIKTAITCLSLMAVAVVSMASEHDEHSSHEAKYAPATKKHSKILAKVDHSQFKILKQKFKSGDELTKACLTCHTNVNDDMHKSMHWTWQSKTNPDLGKDSLTINNYCISAGSGTDKACYDCHIGWDGKNGEINCLKCHSQTLMNWQEAIDDATAMEEEGDEESLEMAAEVREELHDSVVNIGAPNIENCGDCHFNGGGGDATKHGDLDTSLINVSKEVDVHMSPDGQDFTCQRCHTTVDHQIAGRKYNDPASLPKDHKSLIEDDHASKINCISCHSERPHDIKRLDDHAKTIACQTCHIPSLAPIYATNTKWDWSTAGKMKDGKPYKEYIKGLHHKAGYKSIKGTFTWKKDVIPDYMWYDGRFSNMTAKDKIVPGQPIYINRPLGTPHGKNSKIAPFKHHRTNQPYDTVNMTLLAPLLSTPEGYWTKFDWQKAFTLGQKSIGLPYSGKFDFTWTDSWYPTTHMVRPADQALSCIDCHAKDGRLTNVSDVYIPGDHGNKYLDIFGILLVLATILGVALHGLMRFIMSKKRKG